MPVFSGRNGTVRIGGSLPLTIRDWRIDPVPSLSFSNRMQTYYRDEQSNRIYRVCDLSIRTRALDVNSFDTPLRGYEPPYSVDGGFRFFPDAQTPLEDFAAGRRGLLITQSADGLRYELPVLMSSVQQTLFRDAYFEIEAQFVSSGALRQMPTAPERFEAAISFYQNGIISRDQLRAEVGLPPLPASVSPRIVPRRPTAPVQPTRPARRRRLLISVPDATIED